MRIMRRFEWDAGHRVLGHEGKCRHLHGHRYRAEVVVKSINLDPLGRVIDFGVIKEKIGKWIDDHWDHNMLLHPNDPLNKLWTSIYPKGSAGRRELFGDREPYEMRFGNPTAENIAAELFDVARKLITQPHPHRLDVIEVLVYETPNCYAECDWAAFDDLTRIVDGSRPATADEMQKANEDLKEQVAARRAQLLKEQAVAPSDLTEEERRANWQTVAKTVEEGNKERQQKLRDTPMDIGLD